MEASKSFRSLLKALPFLAFGLLQFSQVQAQVIGLQGFYAESSDFWTQVKKLETSADTMQVLSEIFNETEGRATEGMASGGVYYASSSSPFGWGFLSRGIVSLEVEGVAGGYVRNRISPEINGYTTWGVGLSAGFQRHLPVEESGWGMLLLSTTGIGRQQLIHGKVTTYLSEAIEEESTLYYQGFDLGLEWQSVWSDHLRFRSGYFFLPTYFYSQSSNPDFDYAIDGGRWSARWRTQFEVTTRSSSFSSGALEFGGQAIGGPQPIPMAILPRIWDGVHEVDPRPAFGSAVGLGGVLRLVSKSRKYHLEGFGGFYGGYWGAGAAIKLSIFHIRGGTFGVEQSSNYRLRETRVNFVDGGFFYAW